MSSSSSLVIFLTGATGFIGGSVLDHILKSKIGQDPKTHIITLIRPSDENIPVIQSLRQKHKNLEIVEGSHNEKDLVTSLVRRAQVIIHTANSADDLPSLKAILEGLKTKDGQHRLYIHTSGSGEITDDAKGEYATPDSEIWTDLDFNRWNSLPDSAAHRDVDSLLINEAKKHKDLFDAIIIAPPTIYGVGSGEGNRLSQQIPLLIKGILSQGEGSLIGKGLNRWQSVHIGDLADLYVAILTAALEKRASFIADEGGLYFAATGEFQWGDIAREITKVLYKKGLIKSADITHTWSEAEVEDKLGPVAWMALASNSRYKSERAAKEGIEWNPKRVNAVLTSVESDVEEVLKRQEKQKK